MYAGTPHNVSHTSKSGRAQVCNNFISLFIQIPKLSHAIILAKTGRIVYKILDYPRSAPTFVPTLIFSVDLHAFYRLRNTCCCVYQVQELKLSQISNPRYHPLGKICARNPRLPGGCKDLTNFIGSSFAGE